jgi:outer membrane protein OmpA-like peptidoglycan-associated protein
MFIKSAISMIAVAALATGCASTPPSELVDARVAYQQAEAGPAAQLAPAQLHVARRALAKAEESFVKAPQEYQTRDLSYVAERKAQLAHTLGVMKSDIDSTSRADSNYREKQGDIAAQGKQDLADAKRAASDAKHSAAADKASQDLAASEARTAAALAALAELAVVQEEERGLVVTLSGNILFRSSESKLLPAAKDKLDEVVLALLAVDARNLVIEGHTDSRGAAAYNLDLSQRRAESVRDYMVQQKYPSGRIQARGMGEDHPVGDNNSAEGRANNRRVELVVERATDTARK